VEGGVRAAGHGGGVPRDVVDVLAPPLRASERPNRIFEAVKEVLAESGVPTGTTRRALDSTVLDDAVATQDTVTQLIAAIRRVRREVPVAGGVIAEQCRGHDYDDLGAVGVHAWRDWTVRGEPGAETTRFRSKYAPREHFRRWEY
jgi:hypothetical protein